MTQYINLSHKMNNNTVRLDSYLSSIGVSARRKIPFVLRAKQIFVNGERVLEPGIRIDPKKDEVTINGKKVYEPRLEYYLLNKPIGIISTVSDDKRRKTVTDLIRTKLRLFPVGRLDKDTSGIIILTNDGDFTNILTHPRYHVPKTYHALIQGPVGSNTVQAFKSGVTLEEGRTAPCEVSIDSQNDKTTLLKIVLYQGWKRQIRRMCEALGLELMVLERIAIGSVKIGNLKMGEYRALTPREIGVLKRAGKKHGASVKKSPHYNKK